ncbi:proton pump-interactor BIP103-like isoform X2 [Punica granatum]|uniref:Proton pump-interactor BIP103-like isoform X2 n=1 Tax=Punica granatum TaxID=22663 RepID=A0A6P8DQZ0_PUNGR|nr:proton pump-interactor BIP103-like isoform X2 [Punica granatum]
MDSDAHTTPSQKAAEVDSESSENAGNEDHAPKQVHQFYFVKLHAYENPNLIKVENLIRKLEQDLILTDQKRDKKLAYRHELHLNSLHRMHKNYDDDWEWKMNRLKLLQLSLDKLCFSNNWSRGRAIKPSSTVKEINHHRLHFGLLHASKSMAKERQVLGKIKEVKNISKHSCISTEDYDDKKFYMKADEKRQIRQEIEQIEWEREEAIATAAVDGKMWNSLDSKENIKQQIKSLGDDMEKSRAEHMKHKSKVIFLQKELESVEDDLTSFEKQLNRIEGLNYEARQCILQWRMEQDEKNARYHQCIELMRNTQELAEKKELIALQKLSHEQVEKFMLQWSNDQAFRDDYRMKSIGSLNKRCLNIDGQRRNRDEKPISGKEPTVKISKGLKRSLQNVGEKLVM